jgi:hypothetical protein
MTVANTQTDRRPLFERLRAAVNRLPLPVALGLAVVAVATPTAQLVIGLAA